METVRVTWRGRSLGGRLYKEYVPPLGIVGKLSLNPRRLYGKLLDLLKIKIKSEKSVFHFFC